MGYQSCHRLCTRLGSPERELWKIRITKKVKIITSSLAIKIIIGRTNPTFILSLRKRLKDIIQKQPFLPLPKNFSIGVGEVSTLQILVVENNSLWQQDVKLAVLALECVVFSSEQMKDSLEHLIGEVGPFLLGFSFLGFVFLAFGLFWLVGSIGHVFAGLVKIVCFL